MFTSTANLKKLLPFLHIPSVPKYMDRGFSQNSGLPHFLNAFLKLLDGIEGRASGPRALPLATRFTMTVRDLAWNPPRGRRRLHRFFPS